MAVPRSQSVPHFNSYQHTRDSALASSSEVPERHARPNLPRHRSAVAISSTKSLVSVYTPRIEREDPFSLSGFFPASLPALQRTASEQEWDWLHASDGADEEDAFRSGHVSPISDSDDEWNIPTPCSPEAEDALTRDAIRREDKLGVLTLSDTLFLPARGDELYAEEHGLLSPYMQAGDPLDADAVVDALRALRTAYSLPYRSAVKDESAALHELFSPEKESEDKVKVEAEGWGALVSWGVSSVVDYFSPVISV